MSKERRKLTTRNDLVLRAARGEQTERTPIWLMRQAGRTDPEYNKLRENCGLTLEALFRHADLATEISLLPRRLGVDAIIFFQDILTPLAPMGAPFRFNPGPVFDEPVRTRARVDVLAPFDMAEGLPFVRDILQGVRRQLNGELPLLGFAGAPLTLAVFLIEGKSFGDSAEMAMAFFEQEPALLRLLLDKLTDMTIEYLLYQIECGAEAIQLFESAAHLWSAKQYAELALPYQQRIFDAIRGRVPTIMFARERNDVHALRASGADIVSLPSTVSIAEARASLGENQVVQGNLDNGLLARGSLDDISAAAVACVREGGHRGHIFNLSHGLLRETPFEHVRHLVEVVKAIRLPA